MSIHLAMLATDWILWILFFCTLIYAIVAYHRRHLREAWHYVFTQPMGMMAMIVLAFYIGIGLLDSIHLQITTTQTSHQEKNSNIKSILDLIIDPLNQPQEKTYSAPFATTLYNKSIITLPNGQQIRDYAPLRYVKQPLHTHTSRLHDITIRCLMGFATGILLLIILLSIVSLILSLKNNTSFLNSLKNILLGKTPLAWQAALIMLGILFIATSVIVFTATAYHILGTDQVGRDVLYESISSIRTSLLIGTLTTLFMLPFALILGMMAGYFQGWIDDLIQYLYTTLSSIPGVLLISAAILVIQVYIAKHETVFATLRDRADARLLALCLILGLTSWAGLCRLLRGETLKIRELGYIQAAQSLGVKSFKIVWRHIMPNVMHIVLITIALDFSSLVLAEAVLSYVGVGVDPTTASFGNMINASRLELAREPIVWWPLLAALILMFVLILAANIFADTVRDAFDPALSTPSRS